MIVPGGDARIAITTAGSREEAEQIARALVEERLAACVNLLPGVTSVYRWRGEMETAEEVLLLIKTTAERLEELEAAVRRAGRLSLRALMLRAARADRMIKGRLGGDPWDEMALLASDLCARPALPNTVATSGTVCNRRSVCCSSCAALP